MKKKILELAQLEYRERTKSTNVIKSISTSALAPEIFRELSDVHSQIQKGRSKNNQSIRNTANPSVTTAIN